MKLMREGTLKKSKDLETNIFGPSKKQTVNRSGRRRPPTYYKNTKFKL
jgi:hypothetical protein